jgi:hypothetical protein
MDSALVMDERLFFELIYELSAYYATVKPSDATEALPVLRTSEAVENRYIDMMNGQYLLIGSLRIPVLFTSAEETTESAGTLTGDMFFVPLRASDGPITFIEHFPMNNQQITEFNGLSNTTGRVVINNGLYMMAIRSNGFCDQFMLAGKMRMICRAPFLGARIDNIQYGGYVGYRNPFPGNSSFYSGGTSAFSGTL